MECASGDKSQSIEAAVVIQRGGRILLMTEWD